MLHDDVIDRGPVLLSFSKLGEERQQKETPIVSTWAYIPYIHEFSFVYLMCLIVGHPYVPGVVFTLKSLQLSGRFLVTGFSLSPPPVLAFSLKAKREHHPQNSPVVVSDTSAINSAAYQIKNAQPTTIEFATSRGQ